MWNIIIGGLFDNPLFQGVPRWLFFFTCLVFFKINFRTCTQSGCGRRVIWGSTYYNDGFSCEEGPLE